MKKHCNRKWFILGLFLCLGMNVFSQNITKTFNKTPVSSVLKEIEQQTGLSVIYDKSDVDEKKPVTATFQNAPVETVLAKILDENLGFSIENKMLVIFRKNVETQTQTDNIRGHINGIVTDKSGDPLPGVTVVIKGTSIGVITGGDGRYFIAVPNDNAVLLFSYIGMKTEEYPVKGLTVINITMEEDLINLSETVVYTGYMTQRKADLTGSISMVTASDIKKTPAANVMKSLQGKLAGVHITTSNGNPVEAVNVQIRGLTSLATNVNPLIVLDGMPTGNLNLRDINSNDIESIQVLKDASSASIYGSRASGGVILITTKKGKTGKANVEYSGNVSFNSILNKPKLMNSDQYAKVAFMAAAYDEEVYGVPIGGTTLPTQAYDYTWHRDANGRAVLDNVSKTEFLNYNPLLKTAETDWMNEIFRSVVQTTHQLTISNGTEKTKNLLSFGYSDNQGTQITTFFKQYSVRVNNEFAMIDNRLKIGENFAVSYAQYRNASETWFTMVNPPVVPVYDVNGNWAGASGFDDFRNPVRLLEQEKDNINHTVRTIGNFYLDLDIWKGISARTLFGINYGNSYNRRIEKEWSETGARSSNGENYVENNQSHSIEYVWTNTLSYNLHTRRHGFDVVTGVEQTRYVQEGFNGRREGLAFEDRNYAHLGRATGSKYSIGSSADEYTYLSYFGKANYAFDSKYLLSFTLRRDGSSLFGAKNRWGTFPAVSGGWRINNESFMDNVNIVSNLKLRAGYGENGSVQGLPRGRTSTQFISDYLNTSYPIEGNETGPLWSGYMRASTGNPYLKWETTSQVDVAVDYGFFNQLLTGSLGYYFKKTKDILVNVPAPAVAGENGSPWMNGAGMNNQGVEFEISYANKPNEPFQYRISLNLGTYKTKLVDLPESVINSYPGNGTSDRVLNKTPNIYYGRIADGIFKTQAEVDAHAEQPGKAIGRIRYKDIDGNGVIDDFDRTYIGIRDPDFFGGVNFDFEYKNFDLNLFFQGVFGHKVLNEWKYESDFWEVSGRFPYGRNHEDRLLGAWYFDNTDSEIPAISNQTANNEQLRSTYYIEDGSYLKLRNIELGYILPKHISNKMKMQNLRVYASAKNVLTLKKWWADDKYTSFDPEMPNYEYLTPFSIVFGLNVTF